MLMKKSLRFIALGGILALSIPAFLAFSQNTKSVSAYNASSLPTTIDLNDTSASNIRSYYSSLNNLSQSERQGTNLLKNLKTILKNGQKYYSYENGTSIWQMYEITDRDWDKSPASSTTYGTYNSTTNKITNYTYGTSSSSSKNNPYIHALYINRDVNNQTTAWDNHNQDEWGINREHVWPKAEGFDSSGAGGARGDPMHLMAGNGYSNNIHSNYYYGYVKTSSSYTDCGSKYSNQSGNLRGTSKTLDTGTVFEPQDCDKGDIARAIFYMVARYNYLSGSDSDGIDTNNPNLTLTQNINDWSSSGYTSSTSTQGKLGVLTDLLAWHHADPVDEYEIHRNNLLYTNFTNNRNPFIDFPEWADFIWGTVSYSGSTYNSYSSTPTGYAIPSSDTINGYNSGGSTVSVTGVSLNKNSTSITVGGAETLEATVAPSNATNQGVSWSSSNTSIATVSGGTVRGVAEGSATITVTTSDGGYTATCTVTVTASGGGGGGDAGSATITYSDTFSPTFPTSSATVNTSSTSHTDSTSNFVFKEQGIYKNASNYLMFVEDKGFLYNTTDLGTIDSVSVTYSNGTSTSGKVGVYFGSSEQSTYTTSSNQTIKGQSQTDVFNNSTSGNGYFQLSTSNKNVQITTIEVAYHTESSTKTLDSITLDTSDAPTTFNVGDTFSYEGLSVTANYDDGTDDIVTPTSVSTPNMSTAGQKTVTVTYTEGGVTKTATYTITVNAVTLTSIEVSNAKTAYYVGDTFVKPTVTATYSNGSTSDVTNSATFSGYNLSNAGNQTVTVSYTNGTTKTTSYSITVTAVVVTSLEISGAKTSFNVGDTFSFGGTVTGHYNNGTTQDVTASASFSGYDMSTAGNQTVTVSYGGQTTTYSINVKSVSPTPDFGDATLFSGVLTEGYYVIYYNGKAMKNTVSSGRLTYSEVTPTNDTITSPDESIIWHIESSGNYWTIYNDAVSCYAASTGVSNKAQLIEENDEDNSALWTCSSTAQSTTYDFVSKRNEDAGSNVNKILRNNGTYGFACYATGTGGALSLYSVETSSSEITSITASVSKTFYVGETISTSDITVKDNNNKKVTGFSFANNGYQFTYSDAASGGASTSKTFTNSVSYESLTCSLTVQVQRKAYVAPTTSSLEHTGAEFSAAGIGSSYTEGQTATVDGVTFSLDGYVYNSTYLSFSSSKNSAPGKIVNTSPYPGCITNVTVSGASPDIQLSIDGSTWVDLSNATPNTVNYYYLKIFYKTTTQSNYVNITSISASLEIRQSASNVANYVMYEDTANQCVTKFATASNYFGNMSASERATFMTSSDYVIATARERFEAWARYHGKTISYENSDYTIKNASPVSVIFGNGAANNSQTLLIVIVSSLLGVSVIGGYFFLRKRKEQ